MAQPPTPARPAERPAPDRPHPTSEQRSASKAAKDQELPPGAPSAMAQKSSKSHLVAVGTVIHQYDDGSRVEIMHGQPLPDLPGYETRRLERIGAASKGPAPAPSPPGVESKEAVEWEYDAEKGVWIDEQGSMHQAVPERDQEAEKQDRQDREERAKHEREVGIERERELLRR